MIAGTLEIQMMANIARISADMHKAQGVVGSAMKNIESAVASAKSALGALGVGLSVNYFAALIKGSIDAADKINDLSQSMGIAVQELGKYKLATAQSGTTLEALGKGVKGVATAFAEHGDELRAAGITAKDTDGKMRQIADIFASMPDGIEKTTLAVKLLGKSGMELIPMLNMGSAGLAEASEKSAKYAAQLALLAPQADKFNDIMAELGMASKVAGMAIVNDALPAMSRISAAMAIAAHESNIFKVAFVGLGGFVTEGVSGWGTALHRWWSKLNAYLDDGAAKLLRYIGLSKEAGFFANSANEFKLGLQPPPGQGPAAGPAQPKAFDMAAWMAQYKKLLAALGVESKKASGAADKELKRLLDLGTKGEIEALIAREKAWADEQKAINDIKNAGYEEDKKLLDLGAKGAEDAAVARVAAVHGEMNAINDARNAEFEADKVRQQERLREQKRQADEVDRLIGDAVLHGFERGEGFAKNFWQSMVNMAKTVVLRPIISAVMSPVTGAITSTLGGMGLSGAANAAGGLSGSSLLSSVGGLMGSAAGGVPVTSTMGAVMSGAGYAGAGATGMAGTAMSAIGAALPWVGGALAIGAALGLFEGGGAPKESIAKFFGSAGNFGIDVGNVSDAGPSRQSFLAQPGAQALQDALNNPAIYDQAKLAKLVGEIGLGGPKSSAEAIGALAAAMEQAKVAAADMTDALEIATQRRSLEIQLMEAQGDVAGALAAKREDELKALEPTLHALQKQIYAAQDLATAANDASSAVSTLADLLSETQSAVNEQIGQSRSAAQAARAAADSFRQIGVALADAVAKIRGGGRSGAAGRLETLFGTAMTGNSAALSALPQAGQDFLAASLATSRTSLEFARDQAKVVAMLNKAQTVSTAMVNWNEYQATLLEAQTGVLEAIRDQLALPSPDAAILRDQMGMLGTIAQLLQQQTTQVIAGNTITIDQTGKIVAGNALLQQQTTQVIAGNTITIDQTGKIVAGNALVGAQTGQIITGNATQDVIKNISALNTSYSEQQLAALVASGGVQSDSLTALVTGNAMTVSLLQQLVAMQGAAAMQAYDAKFQEAVGTIWAAVQAAGGTLGDFDTQFAAWKASNPMPSYAVGTSFVPNTGPALLHRGERVMTSAANDELLLKIDRLTAAVERQERNTRKSADTLEAVANGQLSFSTEAAA